MRSFPGEDVMNRAESASSNRGTERVASRLSANLDKNLVAYAMAAGAAGVGLLALAQPADAKIVYTPAHRNIGAKTFIDLNHDGISDFKITLIRTSHCVGGCTTTGRRHGTAFNATYAFLNAFGVAQDNQIYGQGKLASALPAGVQVGPKSKFPGGNLMAEVYAASGNPEGSFGAWVGTGNGVQHKFLGLKFEIHGKTHFGWARFDVTVIPRGAHIQATLTGYAYETGANKPIITGKTRGPEGDGDATSASVSLPAPAPASLGLLARGCAGLVSWRRREVIA
jgi:hypothetical protein